MEILVIIVIAVVALIAYGAYSSSQARKSREETISRRKQYVESIAPNAQIIVNNGIHLFFKDDEQQIFGLDESGKTYNYAGLHCISSGSDTISFYHKESVSLCVGKDYSRQDSTVSIDHTSVLAIENAMMPILRRNLYVELLENGVRPTHEYVHEGIIWGCDINSKKFYNTSGSFQIYDFSYLRRVTVEDVSNNSLCSANFIVHVFIKQDYGWDDMECEIYFKSQDMTYHNLLAMFKGIRNRQS